MMELAKTNVSFSGDKYAINVMDLFGFECFAVNRLEQLVVNTMNEQMQCYYNQRVFAWEMVRSSFHKINFIMGKIFFFPFIETLIHSKNKRKRLYLCSVYSFTTTKMR